MVAPVKIEWDKKAVADGGTVRITAYDPYAKNNEWTASASDGTCYTGAEVTSEGFQIFGLPPYSYYSAGIACYMTGNEWMQDNWDVWNNHMDLAGIRNKGIIGFKYFGFGGLAKNDRGVNAFEGTKKGDGTTLNLFLTHTVDTEVKIHVMLDGPYANDVHKGKEIGVITIPANAPRQVRNYQVAVPEVEGLKGKHAIYLVAEGEELQEQQQQRQFPGGGFGQRQPQRPMGLFDLHGIGFSRIGKDCQRPVVPVVTIKVDGKSLRLTDTPVRSTNANGYTEQNRYQVYAPLKDNSVIEATADNPDVKIEVGRVADGRATVKCTYQGYTKFYLIN
jgi:hypothetical protein